MSKITQLNPLKIETNRLEEEKKILENKCENITENIIKLKDVLFRRVKLQV